LIESAAVFFRPATRRSFAPPFTLDAAGLEGLGERFGVEYIPVVNQVLLVFEELEPAAESFEAKRL